MQVCLHDALTVPVIVGPYAAFVTVTDAALAGGAALPSPRWRYFTANPTLDFRTGTTPTNSVIGCWVQDPAAPRRAARSATWPPPARGTPSEARPP